MKLAFAYSRKSIRINSMSEDESVSYQKVTLDDYAARNGIQIVEHYTDVGYSGKNTERPDLQDMIQALKQFDGRIDYILFYSVDRLGRDIQGNINSFMEMDQYVKNIVFISENIASDSTNFKTIFLLLTSIAQQSRENLLMTTANGRKIKIKERKSFISSKPPLGFTKEKGNKKSARLLPATAFNSDDEKERQGLIALQHIFHCFLLGFSLRGIADSLNKHFGLTRNNKEWDHSSVRYILKNATYSGKLQGTLNKNEHYLIENANIEVPIDPLLFDFVQEQLTKNTRGRKSSTLHRQAEYTMCKSCQEVLVQDKEYLICNNCSNKTLLQPIMHLLKQELSKIVDQPVDSVKWNEIRNDSLNKFMIKRKNLLREVLNLKKIKEQIEDFEPSVRGRMLEANSLEMNKIHRNYLFTDEVINFMSELSDTTSIQGAQATKVSNYLLKLPYLVFVDIIHGEIDVLFHPNYFENLKGVS
ncbi:recombinase family protein [Peribacillus simplex]|uniref:Transposon gamma-delta resolvase n=1 Tax=Peribacillus simplex TaxID=1478 RepID=A0A9W4PH17_9BACI|nr:recombinase family protein [Peribacillus simplex]CAH0271032.1 Transposon gamma-delta resolvase [Peribacillus simplex]